MGVIKKLFGKYLLMTNIGSSGLMMAFGDVIQQRIEFYQKQKTKPNYFKVDLMSYKLDNSQTTSKLRNMFDFKHDYVRTWNMTVAGLAQGPFLHYFYQQLDKFLPGKGSRPLMKKLVLDQGLFSPSLIIIFFAVIGIMEKKNLEAIWWELKLKFFDTMKMDLCFWPPIQVVNFHMIPVQYRVFFLNIMVIIYNALLSNIKYNKTYNQLDGLQLELQQA